jgi:hypothetical protein
MRYWWVNQNQTLKYEITGGYMWSPKTKSNGGSNKFYDYMTEVEVGDVVFSFADTKISFIGIATGKAYSASKPNEFDDNESWSNDGWLVPVEFYELKDSIRPKNHIQTIKDYLPSKYSPLQDNGNGNQGVYLTEVPVELADALSSLLVNQVQDIIEQHTDEDFTYIEVSNADAVAINEIRQRKDIQEPEKLRLVKSRNGQGLFKDRLKEIELGCRITGLTDVKYLIASHIKPWAKSNDFEKLDGNNGLLLSPHIDKLFDSGYISFEDRGSMILSPKLNIDTLKLWGINKNKNIGGFNSEQQQYLQYHRDNILKI